MKIDKIIILTHNLILKTSLKTTFRIGKGGPNNTIACTSFALLLWLIVKSFHLFLVLPSYTSINIVVCYKHWGYQQIWSMLQALLFWCGDTSKLLEEDNDM